MSHSGGQHGRERVEQPLRRDLLEPLEGVQQARTEVDLPAGDGEQPAVAGQEEVPLPQVEPRFEPRPGVIVGAVVAARRDPERPGLVAPDPRPAWRSGSRRRRTRPRTAPASRSARRPCRSAGRIFAPTTHPSSKIGSTASVPLHQPGAGLLRALDQERVEVVPRPHEAVVRASVELRPRELDRGAARVHTQALHALEARRRRGRRPSSGSRRRCEGSGRRRRPSRGGTGPCRRR